MNDEDMFYYVGYASGYRGVRLPLGLSNLKFWSCYLGRSDGFWDNAAGVLPAADFNCANHLRRGRGTIVTAISNPLHGGIEPSHHWSTLYILGDERGLGRIVYRYRDGIGKTNTGIWDVIDNGST